MVHLKNTSSARLGSVREPEGTVEVVPPRSSRWTVVRAVCKDLGLGFKD